MCLFFFCNQINFPKTAEPKLPQYLEIPNFIVVLFFEMMPMFYLHGVIVDF